MTQQLHVNGERLQTRLDELARIGALPGGGVGRLAFTEEDKAGRDYVEAQMRELDLEVRIDRIGNLIGLRAGEEDSPPVMTGSHTDTVATGGRFDGSLGVLAGLEAMQTLNEAGITTRCPLAVVSFVNEEGARFMPDMMGSLAFCGQLAVEEARAIEGADGSTIGENLDRLDYAGDVPCGMPVHSFVELHIEQGPVLEAKGLKIGIVEGVQGITWIEYTLCGATAHAGATPMAVRRDAGYVAGEIVHFARQLVREMESDLRATVGSLTLEPNVVNVVAERATLTVDLRHPDAAQLQEAKARLNRFVSECAAGEGVAVDRRTRVAVDPVRFDPEVVHHIEEAAKLVGYPARYLISGAGHDAQILASHCPTAMIFVPSQDGISHNINEYTTPDDVEAGANVLLHTLLRLAR